MSKISIEIGNKFRQSRKMTLDELAPAIHKSRATLSKYERGEISIDIDTLYELSNADNARKNTAFPPVCKNSAETVHLFWDK